MKVKIIGTVKVAGKWQSEADVITVSEELGKELIAKGVAVSLLGPQTDNSADVNAELREQIRAELMAEIAAGKEAEAEAKALAEKKEQEKSLKALRKKATELGIEVADKDIETLNAEVEAVEKLKMENVNKAKDEPKE